MNLLRRAAHRLATWTKGPWECGGTERAVSKQDMTEGSTFKMMRSSSGLNLRVVKPCSESHSNCFISSRMGKSISSKSCFYFCSYDFNKTPGTLSSYRTSLICKARRSDEGKVQPPTSFPRGIPLPRAQVRPMTLATKVLNVRYSFSTTPLSIVFISGIPEPEQRKSEVWWWSAGKGWVEGKPLQRRREEGGERNKWRKERRRGWLIFI